MLLKEMLKILNKQDITISDLMALRGLVAGLPKADQILFNSLYTFEPDIRAMKFYVEGMIDAQETNELS